MGTQKSNKQMESGLDMGGQHIESAAATFPQHTGKLRRMTIDDEEADHYVAETLGGTSRSSKDDRPAPYEPHKAIPNDSGYCRQVMSNGLDCDLFEGNAIHDMGTSRSGDMYKPHTYMPSAKGLLGAPCLMCGGGPEAPHHNVEPKPLPVGEIRVQAIDDKVAGNVIRIEIDNPPTQEARDILMTILPAVLEAWLKKNKDYGDSDELKSLGARAEFVRLWNKMMKLKASLWEGRELAGEQPDEIMGDMIAHLLLALNRA